MRICITPYADELYHFRTKGSKNGVRRYQYPDGSLTPEGYVHYGYGSKHQYKKEMKIRAKMAKEAYKQDKLETKAAKASGDKDNYRREKAEDKIAKQVANEINKALKGKIAKPQGPSYKDITGKMSDSTKAVDRVINKFSDDNYVRKANKDLKMWKDKSTDEIWAAANREKAENEYLSARENKARFSNARRTGTRATKIILAAGTIGAGVYFTKKAINAAKGGS